MANEVASSAMPAEVAAKPGRASLVPSVSPPPSGMNMSMRCALSHSSLEPTPVATNGSAPN